MHLWDNLPHLTSLAIAIISGTASLIVAVIHAVRKVKKALQPESVVLGNSISE
jgi:hypothetical protein